MLDGERLTSNSGKASRAYSIRITLLNFPTNGLVHTSDSVSVSVFFYRILMGTDFTKRVHTATFCIFFNARIL